MHDGFRGDQIKEALCVDHGPVTGAIFQILHLILIFSFWSKIMFLLMANTADDHKYGRNSLQDL